MLIPISVYEANFIIQEANKKNTYTNKVIHESVVKYLSSFDSIKTKDVAQNLRTHLLKFNLSQEEVALIASILPEYKSEVLSLVPSLKRLDDVVIDQIVKGIRSIVQR
ncbi:hypothetical protein EDEG_00611 [Edhazardia aedis USNM 41457]|uniref:RNA polymerase Rpb4/RPC9 core domain-containing protein n=1 Tax=Edhazardia aedis (strain USNM 41457) TaxID=1003232 RepID=J9DC71_EDHAE|nr:hypothetical protein EDEG_00611 [Edhazardia aedis USNM 41457]|eukprot:EJW05341.1 hypothetical protein EDEG_00611 [Edhazardia aedis USNM 41457]